MICTQLDATTTECIESENLFLSGSFTSGDLLISGFLFFIIVILYMDFVFKNLDFYKWQ